MNDPHRALRRLIWLYFWLLIFEGALRKWLLPGLSSALLIVRDPVVIAIYALAVRDRVFPTSGFTLWTIILAAVSFVTSFAGLGNVFVTMYGFHADFLHLPLIFLLPRVLRGEDLRRMGCALLVISLPMTLLALKQFQGGPSSAWNVGAGGEIGGQLYAAAGKVRASGTFSFATGFATYLSVCTSFLLSDLLGPRSYPRWLTFSAIPALALSLVISGSRTAVLSVAIVCLIGIVVGVRSPAQIRAAVQLVIVGAIVVAALAVGTRVFHEGLEVHRGRFESGGGLREGILYRFGQDFVAAARDLTAAPPLGYGLGVGTNVGANLLVGHSGFGLGEGEWERVIMESGAIVGSIYLLLRVAMLVSILGQSILAYRVGQILPLLLIGAGGLDLATGQFGQPTALGFAIFISGLALTAAKTNTATARDRSPAAPAPSPSETAVRGRSAYAERLHRDQDKGGAA